ncbi:hypothetical protein O181_029181 [Austropuccinia psidii MF-1]|uniref:Retroviral polymerase SH3-like domain-containing protein n=1 Tax=Austropuccinia psidii MF-1 TaxID=1389203 RepID=A0A9Q3CQK7_9BASI|nr:hypothetical protein [Austropuccinia psidii MF-1]
MIPTASRNNLSPYYPWKNVLPKIKRLQTFECKVVFSEPKHQQKWKLAPPGEVGILLGYDNENSAYRILKSCNKKVYKSRHSEEFYESNEGENLEEDTIPEEEENNSADRTVLAEEETSAPEPKRSRVTGPRHPTLICSDISKENILPYCRRPAAHFTHTNDPKSFNQAVKSSDSKL